MARILAWCDSPTAPTGFGRSAAHILHALHRAGHTITQLAVNFDPDKLAEIPWRVFSPVDRGSDSYGLQVLGPILAKHPQDMLWTTFDPEVPWKYLVPGVQPDVDALNLLFSLKQTNPGFRMLGWFPVDGGPLTPMEMAVLGEGPYFDAPVTMSPHVYDLITDTVKVKGLTPDPEGIRARLRVIPHGVELEKYRIPNRDERAAAKQRMGLNPDQFVILTVERNQLRKQNYLAHEVLEELLRQRPKLRGEVVLYQHCYPDEMNEGCRMGWNLPDTAWRYGLRPGQDIIWPNDPSAHVSDEEMARTVYACADVFLSTSTGEGFQYPAWEALACGVPLVVPNCTARAAWFHDAPNVHLYETRERAFVMPHAYGRRMNFPVASDAVHIITQLMTSRRRKFRKASEAGREFVAKHASVQDVQKQWVDLVAEEEEKLQAERKGANLTVVGDTADVLVTMLEKPGLGDVLMAAPALRALREKGTVRLRVPREHLDMARLFNLADQYETADTPGAIAGRVHCVEDLYREGDTGEWGDPNVSRVETIAEHLGVDVADLELFVATLPQHLEQGLSAKFLEQFGIDLAMCVVLAFESGNPHRALPRGYLLQMFNQLKRLDLVPLVVGAQPLGIRLHGVVDMTGQADLPTLVGLIGGAGAVVSTDSASLHFAAALGTPLVGCFPTVTPASRMRYYTNTWVALTPEPKEVEGEQWPPGAYPKAPHGAWVKSFTAERMAGALAKLLGAEVDSGPRIIRPTDEQVAAVGK